MYYFVEIMCVISEMWIIHWLLKRMFPMRLLPKWVCPVVYACYSIFLAVLSFIPNISFFRIMLNFGIIWLLGVFLYRATFIRSAFASLVVCVSSIFRCDSYNYASSF